MNEKNKSNQDITKKDDLPFLKKMVKGIKYCWPFSSAIDVMDLPILQAIHFTNQRIISDEENYDIYLFFRRTRPIFEHMLSFPAPRIYSKDTKIGFWEYLFYEPYVYVFPKQTLTYKYSKERTFYNRQIAQDVRYNYTVTVDYLMTPLKERNPKLIANIQQMCWERKAIEHTHIRDKIDRLINTIFGYLHSNASAIPFKLDDIQGTDISDPNFLQLISTKKWSFNPPITDQQQLSIIPINNNHIVPQTLQKNNCPTNALKPVTSFQEVEDAKKYCVSNNFRIKHCYLYIESINY